MALLIRPEHRNHFADILDGAFQLRQRALVDRLGWRIPGNDGVRERDRFDDGDCFHLAVLGTSAEVLGTVRFTPSLSPNLSCDVLAPIMGGRAFPRGPHIIENARACLDFSLPREVRHDVQLDLRASQRQLYTQMGWSQTIGVAYDSLIQRWIRTGMTINVIGAPYFFPGDQEMSLAMVGWEDPDRPNAMTDYLGGRVDALQDPARDPSLLTRFGGRLARTAEAARA